MAFSVNGYDITVNRFDCGVDIVFNFKNQDGSVFDLSGCQIQFILKKETYLDDENAIYNTVLDGVGSQVKIPLEEEMTNGEVGVYHYALRLIKRSEDFVNTIVSGKLNIICNTFSEAVNE